MLNIKIFNVCILVPTETSSTYFGNISVCEIRKSKDNIIALYVYNYYSAADISYNFQKSL